MYFTEKFYYSKDITLGNN